MIHKSAAGLSGFGKVLSLVYAALLTASVHSGLGKHPYAIEPSAFVRTLKLYTISIPFGTLSVALPTISLAIILNDITSPTARQRWLLFGIPTLNALIKVVDVILICTTCALLSARENLQPDTKCFSGNVVINYVYFAISTFHPSHLTHPTPRGMKLMVHSRPFGFHHNLLDCVADGRILEATTQPKGQNCHSPPVQHHGCVGPWSYCHLQGTV